MRLRFYGLQQTARKSPSKPRLGRRLCMITRKFLLSPDSPKFEGTQDVVTLYIQHLIDLSYVRMEVYGTVLSLQTRETDRQTWLLSLDQADWIRPILVERPDDAKIFFSSVSTEMRDATGEWDSLVGGKTILTIQSAGRKWEGEITSVFLAINLQSARPMRPLSAFTEAEMAGAICKEVRALSVNGLKAELHRYTTTMLQGARILEISFDSQQQADAYHPSPELKVKEEIQGDEWDLSAAAYLEAFS